MFVLDEDYRRADAVIELASLDVDEMKRRLIAEAFAVQRLESLEGLWNLAKTQTELMVRNTEATRDYTKTLNQVNDSLKSIASTMARRTG